MALTVIQNPNKFNFSKQTIPFLVSSTLFSTNKLNAVDISFRYIFTVFTMRSDGQYKEFASVAVPARPDTLLGFFDASSIINDALSIDVGTHLYTGATPSTKSLVKFAVYVKERYYDSTSDTYITSANMKIGEYYAIEGASQEGLDPYLVYNPEDVCLPLHHHHLAGKDLILRPEEPLTLSWLSNIYYEGNLLGYYHGQYGAFSYSSVGVATYTGITEEATTVLGTAPYGLGDNGSLITTNDFTGSTINSPQIIFSFTGLVLEANKQYRFSMFARTFAYNTPNTNSYLYCEPIGTNFTEDVNHPLKMFIAQQGWEEIFTVFTTGTGYTSGNVTIGVGFKNATTGNLNDFNNQFFIWDSATLFNISAAPPVGDIKILNSGSGNYSIGTGYTINVVPQDTYNKAKFDTPIGSLKTINGSYQDSTTGLWLDDVGKPISKWFKVQLYSVGGVKIGESARIYQSLDACSKYDFLRLKWLNVLGGWDYFTFTKVSSASTEIERDKYKSQPTVGTTYDEELNDIGYRDLQINETDTITLISDWVDDGTVKWLNELFKSKHVYLLNPEVFMSYPTTTDYELEYPVTVAFEEFEYQNNSMESKLKNVVFTIQPAINFNEPTTNI